MKALTALATLAVAAGLAAGPAAADQKAAAGQPLSVYCNTVPDLSVQRTDQVDNWVRICTVWLHANCGKAPPPPPPADNSKGGATRGAPFDIPPPVPSERLGRVVDLVRIERVLDRGGMHHLEPALRDL